MSVYSVVDADERKNYHVDDYLVAIYEPRFVSKVNGFGYGALEEFTANASVRRRRLISSAI